MNTNIVKITNGFADIRPEILYRTALFLDQNRKASQVCSFASRHQSIGFSHQRINSECKNKACMNHDLKRMLSTCPLLTKEIHENHLLTHQHHHLVMLVQLLVSSKYAELFL